MKKVLVLSQQFDFSTVEVLKWLDYFGIDFIRINGQDELEFERIEYSQFGESIVFKVRSEDITVNLNSIKSFWSRRGRFKFKKVDLNEMVSQNEFRVAVNDLNRLLDDERNRMIEYIAFTLNHSIPSIGNYEKSVNNKLLHHAIAKKVGLLVPETIILSSKIDLVEILHKNNSSYITKPISDSIDFHFKLSEEEYTYLLYTNDLELDTLSYVSDSFYPSMIQKKLSKKFEVRTFYLKGELYSMAIMSQIDEQTKTDFRRYNKERPNRYVPFELPSYISEKIVNFMNEVSLDTGSIDMIYTIEGDFYFLEANPVGQFGMVSYPCNYYLEKEIAKFLAK